MGRFKQVIGDGLRSRTDQRRATEVDVAVHALNRMLELGRPEAVRIAWPQNGVGVSAPLPLIHATRRRPSERSAQHGGSVQQGGPDT